jgi:hypothetical protein
MHFANKIRYSHAAEVSYQGSTAEKSALQKLNQGVFTDVLKPTKKGSEDN